MSQEFFSLEHFARLNYIRALSDSARMGYSETVDSSYTNCLDDLEDIALALELFNKPSDESLR